MIPPSCNALHERGESGQVTSAQRFTAVDSQIKRCREFNININMFLSEVGDRFARAFATILYSPLILVAYIDQVIEERKFRRAIQQRRV